MREDDEEEQEWVSGRPSSCSAGGIANDYHVAEKTT